MRVPIEILSTYKLTGSRRLGNGQPSNEGARLAEVVAGGPVGPRQGAQQQVPVHLAGAAEGGQGVQPLRDEEDELRPGPGRPRLLISCTDPQGPKGHFLPRRGRCISPAQMVNEVQ